MPIRLSTALIAEFIGTFALCFVGILAIHAPGANLVGIALAHGLTIGVMASATIHTSGGHLNPAVTLGFLVTGKIRPQAAAAYIAAQLAAGVVASLLVLSFFPAGAREIVAQGTPSFNPSLISPAAAMVVEIILTFFLVFAIWGTAADPRARNVGGMAIGLAVALDILAGGPLTGASMNPARSFGPTLIANKPELWAQHWVYWVGPILGALGAASVYHLFIWPRDKETGAEPPAADVPAAQR